MVKGAACGETLPRATQARASERGRPRPPHISARRPVFASVHVNGGMTRTHEVSQGSLHATCGGFPARCLAHYWGGRSPHAGACSVVHMHGCAEHAHWAESRDVGSLHESCTERWEIPSLTGPLEVVRHEIPHHWRMLRPSPVSIGTISHLSIPTHAIVWSWPEGMTAPSSPCVMSSFVPSKLGLCQ